MGAEADIGVRWYNTIGLVLVKTMILTAIYPLIELGIIVTLYKIARWADRDFTNDRYRTYMKSVQTYIDLHAGPVFAIDYRYSSILLQFSVALCFGTAMPILFQIALMGCVI